MAMEALEKSDCYVNRETVFKKGKDVRDDKPIGTYNKEHGTLTTFPIIDALGESGENLKYVANQTAQEIITQVLKGEGFEVEEVNITDGVPFSLALKTNNPELIPKAVEIYKKLGGTADSERLQEEIKNVLEERRNVIKAVHIQDLERKILPTMTMIPGVKAHIKGINTKEEK